MGTNQSFIKGRQLFFREGVDIFDGKEVAYVQKVGGENVLKEYSKQQTKYFFVALLPNGLKNYKGEVIFARDGTEQEVLLDPGVLRVIVTAEIAAEEAAAAAAAELAATATAAAAVEAAATAATTAAAAHAYLAEANAHLATTAATGAFINGSINSSINSGIHGINGINGINGCNGNGCTKLSKKE